jgi:predicted Zn finger-like uncharacterized protein
MIIQCEKCLTKFRLDDSRVTEKGVKVRCTKCKNVFSVRKEQPDVDSFEPESVVAGFTSTDEQGEEAAISPSEDHTIVSASDSDVSADFGMFEDAPPRSESADFSSFETSSFDASSISFDSDESHDVSADQTIAVEPVSTGGEVDFSSFDFGDSEVEADSTIFSTASVGMTDESAPAKPKKEVPQGLDFSDDDMFGEVVPSVTEPLNTPIKFDFDDGSFAESMDMGGQDNKGGSLFSLDSSSDAPFSLGEIDFGDELTSVAVQQVNPDDLKPSQQILFAPLAEAQEKSADDELTRAFLGDASIEAQQELPPLSISSRRKQNPLFGGLIAVISVLAVSLLGYLGYSSFSTPKESASQDSGKISIRAVQASYVKNSKLGELLVVSGEALNEYSKSRAALQVKVTVFDAAGQAIATKSAYGGNPLSEEQLESLPLDKIEASMANQFGDSLANMEVAPGKVIPFVVVLAKLPKGAKDFGVQSAGSTVATGKQEQ